ncbi:hypothetical protein [Paenarthrobacter sp. DKR-5]|uniref:hypothetical protein n=1 Tax=Paenarthrobacter sp. DKR-5 TaxID=2835535 RepID=UPI001BDCE6FB|nr:hypothetical protein [Paenarthrobacter sp. DKR-5]
MIAMQLILNRDLEAAGQDSRKLAREAAAGRLVRVTRGAYAPSDAWNRLESWEQHRWRLIATARSATSRPTFCRESAAVLWGLPRYRLPRAIHAVTTFEAGGRSRGGIRRHLLREDLGGAAELEGCAVTSKLQTVLDLAVTLPFAWAVAVADAARREDAAVQGEPLELEELLSAARTLPSAAKIRRALAVFEFSSPLAESAGESVSRAYAYLAGFPAPELQHQLLLRGGTTARLDFFWKEQGLVGEFDGAAKYTQDTLRSGRSVEQVVLAEKVREDRIRALGLRVVRWTWSDVRSPAALAEVLAAAGLRPTRIQSRKQK